MSTSSDKIVNKKSTDPLDQLIFDKGLRMKNVWFDRDMDLIVVLLNNKKVLKRPISDFKRLTDASEAHLLHYENDGISIRWPDLDEDLSLRGFLKYELEQIDGPLVD